MDFERKKLNVDEIEINVANIVSRCISKIKIIIVCAIICAVSLPGLKYVLDIRTYQDSLVSDNNATTVELTEEELSKIIEYKLLYAKKMELDKYMENSLMMQLDPSNVYQAKLQFFVNAEDGLDENIAHAITNYAKSGVLEIKTQTNKAEHIYLDEMIASLHEEENGIIFVRVWGRSEQDCKSNVEVFVKFVKEYSNSLQESMGTHSVTLVEEEYFCMYNEEVYIAQKSINNDYNAVSYDYKKAKENLSDKQKQYLLLMDDTFENEFGETFEGNMESKPSISILFILVGAVCGAAAGMVLIIGIMLFGGKIQSEEEVERRLQIMNLGLIKKSKARQEFLYNRIETLIKNKEINEVGFVSTSDCMKNEEFIKVLNYLSENGIKCNVVGNILNDVEALRVLNNSTSIIFVETIGKTKIKDLYSEASVCTEVNADVVGYLMLEA